MSNLLTSGLVGNGGSNEQILKTWESTGLLDELDDMLKLKVALTMEHAVKIILNTQKYGDTRYDVIIFPVIRRVITLISSGKFNYIDNRTEIYEIISAEFILEELHRIYQSLYDTFSLIYNNQNVDVEAETSYITSTIIAKLFIREFKNKNILSKRDINGNLISVNKPLDETNHLD